MANKSKQKTISERDDSPEVIPNNDENKPELTKAKTVSNAPEDHRNINEDAEDHRSQNKKITKSPKQQYGQKSRRRRYTLVTPRRERYGMDPKRNLFPKTKKHRYYPVTCEYCGKRFQPPKLKIHIRKYHVREPKEEPKTHVQDKEEPRRPKSPGGIPRQMKTCYICGQMFGSRSIGIHEPKCLQKWRIQNEQLPARKRMPEPVKPEPLPEIKGAKDGEYSIPDYDRKAAEAAFKSHLKNLVPCSFCSRTFSPDRVMKHESCCIERC